LWATLFRISYRAVFHHAGVKPLTDQSCQYAVTYPMSEKVAQMGVVYANLANYPAQLKKHGLYFSQAIVWDKRWEEFTGRKAQRIEAQEEVAQ